MSARHVAIQCVSRSSTVDPGVSSSHAPAGLRRRSCIVQDSLDPDSRGARHVTRRDPLRPTAWGVVAPLRRSRTERDELRVLAEMVAVPANSHDGFCPPGSISRPVEHVAAQIFHLDRLRAVDEGDLAGKVAYVSDYVNYAHPLRYLQVWIGCKPRKPRTVGHDCVSVKEALSRPFTTQMLRFGTCGRLCVARQHRVRDEGAGRVFVPMCAKSRDVDSRRLRR